MQDEQDIRAVIAGYFEALYHGDVAGFRRVLHPQVRLSSATDGTLVNLDLETYMGMVAARGRHRRRGATRARTRS
ncbi:nuclear transport factor 2 family protein [Tardiphaga sp. 172_B4_N1_3]|uniref:nuclear transport factor 2 family protein n=1 Tax=Tardiphaga sp. 172_B4_N1_3 TaxID=3240787 RepID=UPI003F8ACFC6